MTSHPIKPWEDQPEDQKADPPAYVLPDFFDTDDLHRFEPEQQGIKAVACAIITALALGVAFLIVAAVTS
jgi:hypothetical protein